MSAKPVRILVVDDSPAIAESLSRLLEQHDFQVDSTFNGSDAMRKIQSQVYDIVVCDIEMPGMSGLDFLEKVRKDGRTQDFILMTGFLEPEYFIRAIRLGAADFINKPIETQQLLKSINGIIEKNRSQDSLETLLGLMDQAQLSFVIDPARYVSYGVTKVCSYFLKQNLRIAPDILNELLICVDEMIHNAYIHGTLGLDVQQRHCGHQDLQQIINSKLSLPEIAAKRIRFFLTLDHAAGQISISVEDDGNGFDHEKWMQRLRSANLLSLDEWGRGLAMLFHLSDSLSFADGGRRVRITRNLDSKRLSGA